MPNGDLMEIPKWLKLIMVFIDRVGFPIMAFIMMFYMSSVSIAKVDTTLNTTVRLLSEWQASTIEFRKSMTDKIACLDANDKLLVSNLERLHDKIKN